MIDRLPIAVSSAATRTAVVAVLLLPLLAGCQDSASPEIRVDNTTIDTGAAGTEGPQSAPATTSARSEPSDVTFDDLKFEIKKSERFQRTMLTKEIEDLSGRSIRIRGYILPTLIQSGITEFVLVRDNMECCFGPGAALYDCILVRMSTGKSTDYVIRPVTVEGRFLVEEFLGPDEQHLAIYQMRADSVE